MLFLQIDGPYAKLVKKGRVSPHSRTSKGKKYSAGKIYLSDSRYNGKMYKLYEAENMHLVTDSRHRKGKGYVVFIPV